MERNEYYASLSLDELVKEINTLPEFDNEQLQDLCCRANLEEEWEKSDGETFISVIEKAANALDVKIIGINAEERLPAQSVKQKPRSRGR